MYNRIEILSTVNNDISILPFEEFDFLACALVDAEFAFHLIFGFSFPIVVFCCCCKMLSGVRCFELLKFWSICKISCAFRSKCVCNMWLSIWTEKSEFDCFSLFAVLESIHLYQRYDFHNETDRKRKRENVNEDTQKKTVMNRDNGHAYRCELT